MCICEKYFISLNNSNYILRKCALSHTYIHMYTHACMQPLIYALHPRPLNKCIKILTNATHIRWGMCSKCVNMKMHVWACGWRANKYAMTGNKLHATRTIPLFTCLAALVCVSVTGMQQCWHSPLSLVANRRWFTGWIVTNNKCI